MRCVEDMTVESKLSWISFVKATWPVWPEIFENVADIANNKMKPIMIKVKINNNLIRKINRHALVKN